jgi:hypothetical protein
MEKECEHKWVRKYYRSLAKGKEYGTWIVIKDSFICSKCKSEKKLN